MVRASMSFGTGIAAHALARHAGPPPVSCATRVRRACASATRDALDAQGTHGRQGGKQQRRRLEWRHLRRVRGVDKRAC